MGSDPISGAVRGHLIEIGSDPISGVVWASDVDLAGRSVLDEPGVGYSHAA
jgi:hypothetical protein